MEDLLYHEAYLLDEWRMEEWLELLVAGGRVRHSDERQPDADPDNDLMYVNHDYRLLTGLVVRFISVRAHREYPWSKTRHLVSNVRVLGEDDGGIVHGVAAFTVWRLPEQGRRDLRRPLRPQAGA